MQRLVLRAVAGFGPYIVPEILVLENDDESGRNLWPYSEKMRVGRCWKNTLLTRVCLAPAMTS